jgi:PPM family protein phosphatase
VANTSVNWTQGLAHAAVTDVGMRRSNNQDSHAVVLASDEMSWCRRGHVFIVADGMGAHAAGELASKLAADNIPHTYKKLVDLTPPAAIAKSILNANDLIHGRGQASTDFNGMGTTCSTLILLPQGALVAHVGDSRIYRLRNNKLEQLTFDHSLVWEMEAQGLKTSGEGVVSVPKNVITRSLGPNAQAKVDLEGPLPIDIGDKYLLCSDGLTGPVTDEELGLILNCLPPQEAAQTLVDLANVRGGPDNITVVIAEITGPLVSEAGQQLLAMMATEAAPAGSIRNVLFTITAAITALTVLFGVFGKILPAVMCGVAAIIAGVVAWMQKPNVKRPNMPGGYIGGPFGKGPHRAYDCHPRPEIVAQIETMVNKLEGIANTNGYYLNRGPFDEARKAGAAAVAAGDSQRAVIAYSRAIRAILTELRTVRQRQTENESGKP